MRFRSLDSLQAAMMLLGLVLHAAMSCLVAPFPVWPLYDPQRSAAFDLLFLWIHTFRTPVFFAVAGYFANLVSERCGREGFIRDRRRRARWCWRWCFCPCGTRCSSSSRSASTGFSQTRGR
jgi:glucan biosynthesis protein C